MLEDNTNFLIYNAGVVHNVMFYDIMLINVVLVYV